MVTSDLKDLTIVKGELYYRVGGGATAQASSVSEAKKELQRVQELSCGDNNFSLYRRVQRQDYY